MYTLALRLLNVLAAAALGILTARILGPAGKGIYALPMVQAGLVSSLFAGITSATSYFLLNRRVGRNLLGTASTCALVFIFCCAIAVAIVAAVANQMWAAWPAILSLPSAAAINFSMGYFVGVKRVRRSSTVTVATSVLTFVLMCTAFFLVQRSARIAIVTWIVANAVVALVALTVVLLDVRRLPADEKVTLREYFAFAWKVGAVSIISLLNYRADLYIVAAMTSSAALGMYTVAVSAAESLLVPTQVAALVTSPHVGSLDRAAAADLTARCVRNNFLLASVVCGVLFALATPIVHLLYGTAFLPLVPSLRVLLVGVFALSLSSPIANYFTLKLGRPELPMTFASISAVTCIAVCLVTVPRIGMLGGAIGSTVAYVLAQIGATLYFSRIANVPVRTILIPTIADVRTYRRLLAARGG